MERERREERMRSDFERGFSSKVLEIFPRHIVIIN
jgi:hypothetical protein